MSWQVAEDGGTIRKDLGLGPLHTAVLQGDVAGATLVAGASRAGDINAATSVYGRTPLHYAALAGRYALRDEPMYSPQVRKLCRAEA